jgi:hypothetical protein
MQQSILLRTVHQLAQTAASQGNYLDVYELADDILRADPNSGLSREAAAKTLMAAAVVYGAPMLLDPRTPKPAEQQSTTQRMYRTRAA